jgi:hypothetical protein
LHITAGTLDSARTGFRESETVRRICFYRQFFKRGHFRSQKGRKELATWAKRFPDEFYEHIYRLRGWKWKGRGKNPPQVVASYTKDIVYARLAPQILKELELRNPIEGGRRKGAHHQLLTDDVGHPALAQHLHAVVTLMRVSKNWDQFKMMLNVAHPKRKDTLQLPLMAEFETDPVLPKVAKGPIGQRSLFDDLAKKDEAAN